MGRLALTCVVVLAYISLAHSTSILDYGATPNDTSVSAARTNSLAIVDAFNAANTGTDRTVVIPSGYTFYIFNSTMANLTNVALVIDGTLVLSNNQTAWNGVTEGALTFLDCRGLNISGSGVVDGQGYDWWWAVILTHVDVRPLMFSIQRCIDVTITGIHARNSPKFHFAIGDVLNLVVRGVTIKVDVIKMAELLDRRGYMRTPPGGSIPIPTFPLNTDGIDPSGTNILIEDCYIENFDDAVAVKPLSVNGVNSNCTQNVVVRNTNVAWGVGMSIGSVPPKTPPTCIRNVTIENINFAHPIKAVYIKTDPGTKGSGIIDGITYRNIHATDSIWYPIWIGPQQQHQPGKKGLGCSWLYPVDGACPSQPRITISNVVLQNATFEGGFTMPGVVLCNATNPCTGFEFTDVTNTGSFIWEKDYVCTGVQGTTRGSTPAPPCLKAAAPDRKNICIY